MKQPLIIEQGFWQRWPPTQAPQAGGQTATNTGDAPLVPAAAGRPERMVGLQAGIAGVIAAVAAGGSATVAAAACGAAGTPGAFAAAWAAIVKSTRARAQRRSERRFRCIVISPFRG
jgi:hypothetical protein